MGAFWATVLRVTVQAMIAASMLTRRAHLESRQQEQEPGPGAGPGLEAAVGLGGEDECKEGVEGGDAEAEEEHEDRQEVHD